MWFYFLTKGHKLIFSRMSMLPLHNISSSCQHMKIKKIWKFIGKQLHHSRCLSAHKTHAQSIKNCSIKWKKVYQWVLLSDSRWQQNREGLINNKWSDFSGWHKKWQLILCHAATAKNRGHRSLKTEEITLLKHSVYSNKSSACVWVV